jgi:hypothetical protein
MNGCNIGLQDFKPLFRGMFCHLRAERASYCINECSQFSLSVKNNSFDNLQWWQPSFD